MSIALISLPITPQNSHSRMNKKGINGCGCSTGLLKYFKPPYARFFESCCNAHDTFYDAGGSGADRRHADLWLYQHMASQSILQLNPMRATWMVLISMLYYVSVRALGWRYFNYLKDTG